MSKKSKKLPLSFPGSESRRALLCFKNNSKEKYREEEEAASKKAEISSTTQSNEPEVQPEAAAN